MSDRPVDDPDQVALVAEKDRALGAEDLRAFFVRRNLVFFPKCGIIIPLTDE